MPKRQIIPEKLSFTVVAGIGSIALPFTAGFLRYLVIIGPANAQGRVKVYDRDNTMDIRRDPRAPANGKVPLEFYTSEMNVPMNGLLGYELRLDNADAGPYTALAVLEERPHVR